jgi:peptidoglycan hydrolase CwlO-like protein
MTIQTAKKIIKDLEENPQANILDSLSENSHVPCPVCGQDAGIKIIKDHINSLMDQRARTQTSITNFEKEKANISKKLDELIQKKTEITTTISLIKSKEAAINNENSNIGIMNQAIEKMEDDTEKLNAEIKKLL